MKALCAYSQDLPTSSLVYRMAEIGLQWEAVAPEELGMQKRLLLRKTTLSSESRFV